MSLTRPGDRQVFSVPSLDGLRALAIAAVFGLHLAGAYFPGGGFGVDVFFVLSAYLITTLLLREFHDRGQVRFGAFYWRRACRLGPALLLWLVLIAAPTALLEHAGSSIPWSSAGAVFYSNDFLEAWTHHIAAAYDQSWSLAVEEQFYLLWPFLLVLVSRYLHQHRQRLVMSVLVAVSILISFLAGSYLLPTGHLVALSLGAWAAFWAVQVGEGRLRDVFGSTQLAIGCAAALVVATFVTASGHVGDARSLLVDLAAMVLVLHCTFESGSIVTRRLAGALPRWVGVRSYGIYLYGLTIIQLIPLVTHLTLRVAAPLDVLLTAGVAALSFRYVEAPIRDWGRRRLRPPTAPETAPRIGELTDHGEREAVPAFAADRLHGRRVDPRVVAE